MKEEDAFDYFWQHNYPGEEAEKDMKSGNKLTFKQKAMILLPSLVILWFSYKVALVYLLVANVGMLISEWNFSQKG